MTRHERIRFLLEHYRDVEEGLQEWKPAGDERFLPLMCRAWNHPSYVELRRLRPILRDSEPFVYWHVAEQFFRYHETRIAECPRCHKQFPPSAEDSLHRHGRDAVTVVAKVVRRVSFAVNEFQVERGIAWMDDRFRGEPFVPDDLLVLAA